MKLKMSDAFELEAALSKGGRTKHWALMKPLNKMLIEVRKETEPHRDSLEATQAMKAYRRAADRLRAANAGEKKESLEEMLRLLRVEHAQAHIDADEIHQLGIDMDDDEVDLTLEQIAESLLHDGGVLRIEPEAYIVLSRLGLVKE